MSFQTIAPTRLIYKALNSERMKQVPEIVYKQSTKINCRQILVVN